MQLESCTAHTASCPSDALPFKKDSQSVLTLETTLCFTCVLTNIVLIIARRYETGVTATKRDGAAHLKLGLHVAGSSKKTAALEWQHKPWKVCSLSPSLASLNPEPGAGGSMWQRCTPRPSKAAPVQDRVP